MCQSWGCDENKYSASFGSIPISSKYLVQRQVELHDYTALVVKMNHLSLALGHLGLFDVLKKLLFCENLKKARKTHRTKSQGAKNLRAKLEYYDDRQLHQTR